MCGVVVEERRGWGRPWAGTGRPSKGRMGSWGPRKSWSPAHKMANDWIGDHRRLRAEV